MGEDAPPKVEQRWEGRPGLARAVRFAVAAAPVAAAVGCSSLVSRALPTPTSNSGLVTWWAFVLIVSTSALVVTDRFARRLLPLSVLLKLSLPFPEAPPSRIRVAIRSGSAKQLEKWAASVAARGRKDPKAVAAHELLGLVAALSAHDRRSRGHSERVRVYTDLMAEQLGLSRDDADKLRWAGLLHDIGKIRVPGEILNKPGAPDPDEWAAIRQHPSDGDRLIEPVRAWLGPWAKAVIEHHERWDGKGYPRGLSGHHISLAGRVVAVTDSYEVMTATRSYKKPMSVKAAREELTRSAGTHFDPAMVRAFLSVPIGRVRWTAGPIAWLAQLPFLAQIPTWGATAMMATGVVVATPLVTGVAAQEVSPDTVEVVDTGAQLSTDSEALTIQVTTTVVDASTEPGADPVADTSSSGRPLEKAPPPGKTKDTTTTTTTTTPP
ncbi:MAG: hypothetical protein QOD38_1994, partial [Acidimicrobiaceae bacterium]